jgi:hypothetical protein
MRIEMAGMRINFIKPWIEKAVHSSFVQRKVVCCVAAIIQKVNELITVQDTVFLSLCVGLLDRLESLFLKENLVPFFMLVGPGWVGYGEARGSIAAFLFKQNPDGSFTKLRKVGGPGLAQM